VVHRRRPQILPARARANRAWHPLPPRSDPNSTIQGFTQTQQDEEDWSVKQGKTTRRQGDEKARAQTVLAGRDATELYLQCYQLILWKQCFWLAQRGFPRELETVVRDLWGLRLGVVHGEPGGGGGSSKFSTAGFSSTSEGENTDSDAASVFSRRSSRSDAGREKLPKLVETLALCYLGMLLMRLPVSMGELHGWATREEMGFTRAVSDEDWFSCYCHCSDEH
jgi:RNA polymerase I-specific transcription initiation factor RRN7